MQPQIAVSDEGVEQLTCDALLVGAFSADGDVSLTESGSAIDRALEGRLKEHLQDNGYKAKVGEVVTIPSMGRLRAKTVAVVGLGNRDELGTRAIRRASGSAARRVVDSPVVATAVHEALDGAEAVEAAIEGLLLGSYRFTRYKSDPHPSKIQRILFLRAEEPAVERGRLLAEATGLARDLINEPAGALSPENLARTARDIADVNGLECKIWEEDELADKGFGGILGVGQGSVNPPRLIELRYVPESPTSKVAILGKGVTFDSGGLSIKDAKNMETMKTDMSGGAAVIGAMSAIAKLAPSVEVLALVPATENMPGGRAIKPGDVIRHYGGRTSEVLNTDAEGRLILADAIAYACEQSPEAIVDVATLTGAMMVALGLKSSGLFSNDDSLAQEIEEAARSAGERVWRMPLYDDYRSDLDSEVADIKNTGSRWGGSIMAALFLRDFLSNDVPWAHLDIAGPARAESDYDEVAKGGTGVTTRTLLRWIEMRDRSSDSSRAAES